MKKEKEKKKKREKKSEPAAMPESETVEISDASPMRYLMSAVGGKWKLSILWALRTGEGRRYGDIKTEVQGITDMMLSQSLRELTADGLCDRKQYQEIPPRVEYRITGAGAELIPALAVLLQWAAKHKK